MKEQKTKKDFMGEFCEIIELLSPSMDDFLYVLDFENDIYYISPQATRRFLIKDNKFGNTAEEFLKFVYPDDMEKLEKDLFEVKTTDKMEHNLIYRWISVDNKPIWINCRGKVIRENGKAIYLVGCINEIGARQKADNLSGLLGEGSLKTYLEENLSSEPKGYVLRVGLDNLKFINARMGLEYGDKVLQKTAECISKCIVPGQQLYSALGDEFILLDFNGSDVQDACHLYGYIRQQLERFMLENNYEVFFTISAGVIPCDRVAMKNYSELMKLTEFALDEAKNLGRNRCYIFDEEDYKAFLRKRQLMIELRKAINRGFEGFELYYQPIFRADNEELYGAEALMRFQSRKLGRVSPGEFIPILEDTGLILPVGLWLLDHAFETTKEFIQYVPEFHINVNLSNIQVSKSNIGADILHAVERYGLDPQCVTVELTESGFLESDNRFMKMWNDLKDAGILVALDDFGSGYSNFRYISALKPDVIKIDRTFTEEVMKNEFEYELLCLFTKMAHHLQLKICVEGIETEEERRKIYQLAPDCFQGFYFGHPCSYDEFMEKYIK